MFGERTSTITDAATRYLVRCEGMLVVTKAVEGALLIEERATGRIAVRTRR
jgi:hypothetical protein